MKKHLFLPALLLIVIPLFASTIYFYQKSQKLEKQFIAERIIDGDTFVLGSGQRVRLLGITAPELDFCGGQEAANLLEEIVLGRPIRLEDQFFDKYGRAVALAYANNILVNEVILKEGWARYDGAKSSQSETLRSAYQLAREEKKGIFSSLCRQEKNLDNPQCSIKGNIDKGTGKKTYHFPGCREYNTTIIEKDLGEEWFCIEEEALKAGFKKSQNCYGKKFSPKL